MKLAVSQPLPLQGARNTRDLGGYPAGNGRTTCSHVFLRGIPLRNWPLPMYRRCWPTG